MINNLIAFDLEELEKKKVLAEAKTLYQSKILSDEQLLSINNAYASKLYTPTIFMRVLLFVLTYIGMVTVLLPISTIFSIDSDSSFRVFAFALGILFLWITDKKIIKEKNHYLSGITEAGIFAGIGFLAFAILGFKDDNGIFTTLVLFLFSVFASIRYLNRVALVVAIFMLGSLVFQILIEMGQTAKALIPFVFMLLFAILYFLVNLLHKKSQSIVLEDHFIILKSICLFVIYISGNYFVVRELSTELMELSLAKNQDIPFAFLFYFFTAALPFFYLFVAIKKRSLLFLRIALLILALSVITFKYYFSLGHPEVTITVSGFVLIAISLFLFRYLKKIRNGFTQDLLLKDKWNSKDLMAIIASQTLGGNKLNESETVFKGGNFGGGGAGSNW